MKSITMDSVKPKVLAPGMYAIDVEPLPPHCSNNKEVHLDYLKHLKESVATLREIVEESRVERPLDRSLAFACLYIKHSQELLEYVVGTCSKDFINEIKSRLLPILIGTSKSLFRTIVKRDRSRLRNYVKKFIRTVRFENDHFGAIMGYGDYVIGDSEAFMLCSRYKCITMDSVKPKVLAPGMYAIDVEPLPPHCSNNKEVHLDYLKHLKESVATLREIVEESRVERPLDRSLAFACLYIKHSQELLEYVKSNVHVIPSTEVNRYTEASGSKPRSNTKKNRISSTKSVNKKKVEEHPRTNKRFCDSDLEAAFRKHSCYVRDTNGVELIKGYCGSNLYTILVKDMLKSSPICLLSKSSKNKSWLWNRHLNHMNFGTFNDLARNYLVRGLLRLKFEKDQLCLACQLGKSKKHSYKPKAEDTIMEVLHTLHIDLCGLMRVQSINGKKYILVIIDDYSRFTWVNEDLVKLQSTADIGIFVGYAPTRKGYRIYNKRTQIIIETIHVQFNELSEPMAPMQLSTGLAPSFPMPGQINLRLIPSLVPIKPYVPPTNKELEILFQPMFDEYLEPPHDERKVSPATAAQVPIISPSTPCSTTINQDAPSPSHSPSSSILQPPISQKVLQLDLLSLKTILFLMLTIIPL
nr:integrase, catalytic region, zinc finger, CCHC-type, peptidase aspartic, catalytic [Tanacetum cinerariifolium]